MSAAVVTRSARAAQAEALLSFVARPQACGVLTRGFNTISHHMTAAALKTAAACQL